MRTRGIIRNYGRYIAVLLLLVFLYKLGALRPAETLIVRGTGPVLAKLYDFGKTTTTGYENLTSKKDLAQQNKELNDKLTKNAVDNSRMYALEEENRILRQHLNFLAQRKYKYAIANVITIGGLNAVNNDFVIDKGLKDGLANGLLVVNEQGVAIGKIVDIKESISYVAPSTNDSCKLAAAIQNSNKTSGVTHGELGLTIKMDFITQTEAIKEGDAVVTSGLESNIPRGIVIGKISKVVRESNDLWQSAVIEPLVKMNDLIIVSVLIP